MDFLPQPASELRLRRIHSFFTKGQTVEIRDLPRAEIETVPGIPARSSDPNGHYQVGQMYGQFFEQAAPQFELPVLFWHGGGMTGAAWGDTPDGRAGWHDYFMRLGFNTCVTDAVERGRSSWAPYPFIFDRAPEHRTIDQAWSIFRFGPNGGYADATPFTGQRFPVAHADELARQFVARWSNHQDLVATAYGELLARFGKSIIVAHSEGARYALQAAADYPDAIAAVILLEPAGKPNLSQERAKAAARVPHLVVWGDYFEESPLWTGYRHAADQWLGWLKEAGGNVTTIDLPATGVRGNSHLLMMDDNADDIAALAARWLIPLLGDRQQP